MWRQFFALPFIFWLAVGDEVHADGVSAVRDVLPAPLADMTPAVLQAFFGQHADDLNLFCSPARRCTDILPRQQLLQRFLRGSFARLPVAAKTSEKAGTELSVTEAAPSAAYASHAAAYFTQAQYACRHPLTAAVLESVWQISPATVVCPDSVPFWMAREGRAPELRWIDTSRVYSVHLLFAGSMGGGISRFGHVGLRVVQCHPQRKEVSEECEKDLFDHVTLSFKANIDELGLSLWKGVTGAYPVKLYASTFMDTYREYTIDEFRPLYSLPLVLDSQDQALLLRALSEVHWSYQNEYRFFTRNCATELQWLLDVVSAVRAPSRPTSLVKRRYRPDHLFADAREASGFSGNTLSDLKSAEQGGYYFPGAEAYYQMALDVVTEGLPLAEKEELRTPDAWRQHDVAFRRQKLLRMESAGSANEVQDIGRRAHAGIVMESWVERGLRRQMLANLALYYGVLFRELERRDAFFTAEERGLMQSCGAMLGARNRIGEAAAGLPLQVFLPETSECNVTSPAMLAATKRFFEAFPVSREAGKDIAELEATTENIRMLRAISGD
ncbi:MAG: DUF4105 domain-containing protein [Moraxellaceae bacterium]